MRRKDLALALLVLLAALLAAPAAHTQEEPPLIEELAEETEPTDEMAPDAPIGDLPSPAPPPPKVPLRASLDYQRWREMNIRERQTFVEGIVLTLTTITERLKGALAVNGRVPHENLDAVVKFVHDLYPRLPPGSYVREMETIYLTAEGQNLSMMECFLQAFRRLNSR